MQGIGCLVSIAALMLWNYISSTSSLDTSGDGETNDYTTSVRYVMGHLLSLTLVIIAGIIEVLGAQLASVAVKKEWVPIVFNDNEDTTPNKEQDWEKRKILSFLCFDINYPNISLGFINTSMTNIDLTAAMFGPILSGWILQVMGNDDVTSSMQGGFVVVALFNIISFVPEALLLRRVYNSCADLRDRSVRNNGVTINTSETTESSTENKEETASPWSVWYHHPSGLPLLTISLASLYLTALSPSGVVLTSYLVMVGMTPKSIGIFRAVGALSGVTGLGLFSIARHWGEDDHIGFEFENEDAMRSSSAKSVEQLRRVSLAFLLLEVVSVLMAAYSFSQIETFDTMNESSDDSDTPPWHVVLFLGSICVSRAGLYSFDIGALEIQQYIVDERYRNAVGSVEGALCSLVEMGMYLLSILFPNPSQFGFQVGVSATAVSFRYVWKRFESLCT